MLLPTFLAAIPDHRRPQGRLYGLEHLLLFSILAILSDATSYRKISHRTRTATGSRVSAQLASVIDTCRQRGHSPWLYLQTAIADWRAGQPLAALPR